MSIKPSELPVDTVIDDPTKGKFFKESEYFWIEFYPSNGITRKVVQHHGYPDVKTRPKNYVIEKADDYFTDFEIVSAPVGWIHPDVDHEVVYWYDLANLRAVRKTTIHEIIEDDGTLQEEDLMTAKATLPVWRDIPFYPNYETKMRADGRDVYVRNKKTKKSRQRNGRGFFILSENGKRVYWCEGELGTASQIHHFYKTGEVGADV